MKKIISTLAVFAGIMAYSQITIGARANVLFPTDSPKWESFLGSTSNMKNSTGFNVGLAFKIDIPASGWFVMPEIYYTYLKKEADVTMSEIVFGTTVETGTYSAEAKSNRIDVPVMIGHNFLLGKLGAFIGPVASYNLSTKDTFQDFKENAAKEFTLGYQFGVQATISKFVVNARYEAAFSKDTRVFKSIDGQEISYDNRPSMFILGIGYNFK